MACQDCNVDLKNRPAMAVPKGWVCPSCFMVRLKAPNDGK